MTLSTKNLAIEATEITANLSLAIADENPTAVMEQLSRATANLSHYTLVRSETAPRKFRKDEASLRLANETAGGARYINRLLRVDDTVNIEPFATVGWGRPKSRRELIEFFDGIETQDFNWVMF